jgi:nitric oxide reductase NorD protein
MSMSLPEQLIARLSEHGGRETAVAMVDELISAAGRPDVLSAVLVLLDELQDVSSKASAYALEAFPDMTRRHVLDVVVPWLDLGMALAELSGAVAMKYFKESPLILGLIDTAAARHTVLEQALELAEHDANAALEFFRTAPELVTLLPSADLAAWCDVGMELARWNFVLGIEFFRQSPAVAKVISLDHVRAWVGFGMKLMTQNSLGKPDYMGTLEFFRSSPAILCEIDRAAVRKQVIDLGSALAVRDPQQAIAFLAESESLLRRIASEEWQARILHYADLVAERDADAMLSYVRRCPELLELIGDVPEAWAKFEEWYKGGMEVLALSVEGGRAYFASETHKALASIEQAMSGMPLRRVARSLKLFAEGLCGTEIFIRSLPEPEGPSPKTARRPMVSADGRIIFLPAILRQYPTQDENARLYTIMTAHEAGHLEFGTYHLHLDRLTELIAAVQSRYGRSMPGPAVARGTTLSDVFALYPQPGLMRDLWALVEDARVEHRLQQEYPGLARDLVSLAQESVQTRSLTHGMTVREMVVECLLLLSTQDPRTVRVPEALTGVVEQAWNLCRRSVLTLDATAADAVRLADRLYVLLEGLVAGARSDHEPEDSASDPEINAGSQGSEEGANTYRPVTNLMYRGDMDPAMVKDRTGEDGREDGHAMDPARGAAGSPSSPSPDHASHAGRESVKELADSGAPAPTFTDEGHDQSRGEDTTSAFGSQDSREFLYDEWDGVIQDYRSAWCRVIERTPVDTDSDFVDATINGHGAEIRVLRRYFESLRPSGLRRMFSQVDGEDPDLDATIRRIVDRRAGVEASDRIYVRRDKREREVAVAFLVDLSGSTSRQIDAADSRRVIDVEKEALVLLCEALEAIGDQYAIYGYSSQGRRHVDFVLLKDFDEPLNRSSSRIGGLMPLQQNRDGAAIRHAARKLHQRAAQVRLLVLLSDGKPLDDAYVDEYALEDTKMALQEVRRQGLHPFCITVDRDADEYVRRMYGDVRYLVIDQAAALPEKLPRIYQRLTA